MVPNATNISWRKPGFTVEARAIARVGEWLGKVTKPQVLAIFAAVHAAVGNLVRAGTKYCASAEAFI